MWTSLKVILSVLFFSESSVKIKGQHPASQSTLKQHLLFLWISTATCQLHQTVTDKTEKVNMGCVQLSDLICY